VVHVCVSFARGDLRVEVHDDAPGWRPVRKRAAGEDGSGCCLALLDGLIGPYGGSRGVAHDSTGRRKTVYVMRCLALTRRAGHPRMARCPVPRHRPATSFADDLRISPIAAEARFGLKIVKEDTKNP
jgi:hypothetical protein